MSNIYIYIITKHIIGTSYIKKGHAHNGGALCIYKSIILNKESLE